MDLSLMSAESHVEAERREMTEGAECTEVQSAKLCHDEEPDQTLSCPTLNAPEEYIYLGPIPSRQVWRELGFSRGTYIPEGRTCGCTPGHVYFIEAVGSGRVKLGWSRCEVADRLKGLQTGSPFPLVTRLVMNGTQRTELALHHHWKRRRVHGEWFLMEPEIAEFIRGIGERLP